MFLAWRLAIIKDLIQFSAKVILKNENDPSTQNAIFSKRLLALVLYGLTFNFDHGIKQFF
jgi:hypothetical protein